MVKKQTQTMTRAAYVDKNKVALQNELAAYKEAEKQKAEEEKTERLEALERKAKVEREFASKSKDLDGAVSFLNALINKDKLAKAIQFIPRGQPPSSKRSGNRIDSGTAAQLSVEESIRCAAKCAREDKRTIELLVDVRIKDLEVLQDCDEEKVNGFLEKLEEKKAKKKESFWMYWRRRDTDPEGAASGEDIDPEDSADKEDEDARSEEALEGTGETTEGTGEEAEDEDDSDDEEDCSTESEVFSRKKKNLTYDALDVFFGKLSKQKTEALEMELKIKRTPLAWDQFKGEQRDKSYAIVIAGESGAGKSVFACQKALKEKFSVLYRCLEAKDFEEAETRKPQNLKGEFLNLNGLVELAIKEAAPGTPTENELYAFKRRLNTSRDGWAMNVLRYAINKNDDQSCMKSWIEGEGWRNQNRPENVAIVVDEATDIDLIEGLVASVREIITEYSHLAQKNVLLVIAGVGSDLIKEEGRIGTNPSHSKLVVVKGPDMEALKLRSHISEEVVAALERGTFARTLKTNSRMLFRSVLPILEGKKHRLDASFDADELRSRLEDRLVDIASFGPIMDHGCRFYVRENSLTRFRLLELLSQAFCYHLVTAMEGVKAKGSMKDNLDRELNKARKFKSYAELNDPLAKDNIFTKGLSSRSGTSSALKFLACFGLTCELRPSFGDEFEEMTALHYTRYQQVQGYRTRRVKLRHAWPPQCNKNDDNITVKAITELDDVLEEQKMSELVDESAIRELKNILNGSSPPCKRRKVDSKFINDIGRDHLYCVVFDQGTPTAQGGDVLALLVDTSIREASLDCIQCKHFQKKDKNGEIRKWWNSLGVLLDENGSSNFEPTTGSAGYSYKGLQKFAELLSAMLSEEGEEIKVKIGTRILAASFHSPKREDCKLPMPEVKNQHPDRFRVWFREMMEPTISAIQPKWEPMEYSEED